MNETETTDLQPTQDEKVAEVQLLQGGITIPEGYEHIHTSRLDDQEDDSIRLEVKNVHEVATKDETHHNVSMAFTRASADPSQGVLLIRKLVDQAIHVHVFRKDDHEKGVTTFRVTPA